MIYDTFQLERFLLLFHFGRILLLVKGSLSRQDNRTSPWTFSKNGNGFPGRYGAVLVVTGENHLVGAFAEILDVPTYVFGVLIWPSCVYVASEAAREHHHRNRVHDWPRVRDLTRYPRPTLTRNFVTSKIL